MLKGGVDFSFPKSSVAVSCDRAVRQCDRAVSQIDRPVSQCDRVVSFGRDGRGFRASFMISYFISLKDIGTQKHMITKSKSEEISLNLVWNMQTYNWETRAQVQAG